MYERPVTERIQSTVKLWEQTDVQRAQSRLPERHDPFTTISGATV